MDEHTSKLTDHYGDVGPGWHGLLSALHYEMGHISPDYKVLQVKEKFGALRIYLTANGAAQELVHSYERMSMHVCEECGKAGECYAGRNREEQGGGWVRTMCTLCREEFWTNRKTFSERMKEINA